MHRRLLVPGFTYGEGGNENRVIQLETEIISPRV